MQELKNVSKTHKEFQSLLDQDFKYRKLKEKVMVDDFDFDEPESETPAAPARVISSSGSAAPPKKPSASTR